MLFIDLDGTLIKTISGKTFPEDVTDFRIRKEVIDKITEKLPNLERIAIVSNQGGIDEYVDEEEFNAKLKAIVEFVYLYASIWYDYPKRDGDGRTFGVDSRYCPGYKGDSPNRKPNPGMLEASVMHYERYVGLISKDEMMMIGDASGKPGNFSDSDKKCAENFNVEYMDVEEFLALPNEESHEQQDTD